MVGALAIFVALPGDLESFRPSLIRLVDKGFPGYLLGDAAASVYGFEGVSAVESKIVPVSRSGNQYMVFGRYATKDAVIYRDVYFIEQGVYQPLLHVRHTDEKYVTAAIARDEVGGIYYFEAYTQGSGSFDAGAVAYRLVDGRSLQEIPVRYRTGSSEKLRWEAVGSSVYLFTEPDGSNGRVIFAPTGATISESAGAPGIVGVPVITIDDAGGAMLDGRPVDTISLAVGEHLILGKSAVLGEVSGQALKLIDIGGEFLLIRAERPGVAHIHLNLAYRDAEAEYALVQAGRTLDISVTPNRSAEP